MQGLKDADNPLDFIRNNLRQLQTSQVDPVQVVAETEKKRAEQNATPSPTTPSPVPESGKEVSPYPFSVKSEAKPEAGKDSGVAAQEPAAPGEGTDKEENFKVLRQKAADLAKMVKEKEKSEAELQVRIKKYETGADIPEVLKSKEARIAELERYEQLHALKVSPAYKEKFVKPVEDIKKRLELIAADYSIPKEELDHALGMTNVRELNTFLSEHFDEVGALEVKQLVTQAQGIISQSKDAEAAPSKILADIEADYKNLQEAKRQQANSAIIETSKEAWIDSLIKIKDEGRIPELIIKDADEAHNKQVEPILQAASTEYGKIIRMLAENGLEKLPKDVAFALARMVHLAHGSALSVEARNRAEAEVAELRANVTRTTRYERPSVGGGGQGGNSAPAAPKSPADAADMLINQVLSHRGQ